MHFTVLTIFPEMFGAFLSHGMIKRAVDGRIISMDTIDIRGFAKDRHRTTDDRPYGGGAGMVMKPEPLAAAIRAAKDRLPGVPAVALTPQGERFDQSAAQKLAAGDGMILVCGRYEGMDERVLDTLIDGEISIGDYVLTGGELAAMVVIETVARLVPGVLGAEDAAEKDSFSDGLLEHAHYTRPRDFEGRGVPAVLLSGDHQAIESWRAETSLMRTFLKRPDLLARRPLDRRQVKILEKWRDAIEELIEYHRSKDVR